MNIAIEKSVRELALENPAVSRVFEKLGIDYCCGGKRSLEEACRAASLNADEVRESLKKASEASPGVQKNWQDEPLAALITHIQETHHQYTREEIGRFGPLFAKVCSAHGKNHPELLRIRDLLQGLTNELVPHLLKEEVILFPYLIRIEEAVTRKEPISLARFGSVQNPISMMEHDHDSAGSALRAMREDSSGYSAPADACLSYQTLYKALVAFEADLHQHIHLENNILFPRAVAMERACSAKQHA
jgi:regulator of cell morphogenesis and NO signaling